MVSIDYLHVCCHYRRGLRNNFYPRQQLPTDIDIAYNTERILSAIAKCLVHVFSKGEGRAEMGVW